MKTKSASQKVFWQEVPVTLLYDQVLNLKPELVFLFYNWRNLLMISLLYFMPDYMASASPHGASPRPPCRGTWASDGFHSLMNKGHLAQLLFASLSIHLLCAGGPRCTTGKHTHKCKCTHAFLWTCVHSNRWRDGAVRPSLGSTAGHCWVAAAC